MCIVKIKHQPQAKPYLCETSIPLKKDSEVLVENALGKQYGIVMEDSVEADENAVNYILSVYYCTPLAKVIGLVVRV